VEFSDAVIHQGTPTPQKEGVVEATTTPVDQRLIRLTGTWLASKRSAHTRTSYRRDLQDWLNHCDRAGLDPLRARMNDVDEWIIDQRLRGGRNGRPAAEASIARRISTISSWYAYLVRNSADDAVPLIARNPAITDARPRIDPDYSPTVGLTRTDAERLIHQADADSPTAAALIRLFLTTGIRVGSAVSARIENLAEDRGHRVLDVMAKQGRVRRTPLPPTVAQAIDAMLAERDRPEHGPLFLTATGRSLYELYVYRLLRRLARQAGLTQADRLSPHSLRHTAITELLDASGGDLRRAQDFAGHADPRTTRRYDRNRDNLDRHGAYLLAARFTDAADDEPGQVRPG
jgi:site-specific recombinase XerD